MTNPFTLQNIKGIEFTNTLGTISGACVTPIDTGGVCVNGFLAATVGVSAGTLRLTGGSITDTSGAITFGNESLTGTGAVEFSGGVSLRGGVSINQFTFPSDLTPVNNNIFTTDGNGVISLTTNGGGGGGTPGGNDTDIQFNDRGNFGGVSALQFHKSTTSGVSALTVDGNVFSSMGVCDATSASGGGGGGNTTFTIPPVDFVNGFVFPPCYSAEENQLFVVKVPTYTDIGTSFPEINEGQTFDTVIYGTSIGSSPAIGISFPSDITVLENMGTIFDRRLASDKTISGGLSFHFAGLDLKYYQGVVIRSRMGSNGVSMYPYATSFYTC